MRRTELDPLILRWKKTTAALKYPDQQYGKYITDLLEKRTDRELALFRDPVEAAAFFCLLEIQARSLPDECRPRCRPPGQAPIVAEDGRYG